MTKILIIGAGFAGCAAASFLKDKFNPKDITIIDKLPYTGAGVRTFFYGGHPYTFGPRHFLTKKEWIFDYLNSKIPLRRCNEHQFITYVEKDREFYNYPIHVDDIDIMPEKNLIQDELKNRNEHNIQNSNNFESYWINSIGNTLYEKFINTYSKKMWMVEDNTIIDDFGWSPKGATLKSGPKEAWDVAISAYPKALNGYNDYFEMSVQETNLYLNGFIDKFDIKNKKIHINGEWHQYDIIINTISPDILFDFTFGELPFIGRDFHKLVLPVEHAFPKDVYFVYYAGNEPHTRIVEYKKLSNHIDKKSTLIGIEIPSLNGKHYPLPLKKFYKLADKYFELMPDNVFSIGRAGSYRYQVDIDDCIEQAKDLLSKI